MPARPKFIPGQRWASDMEPELGLGTVTEADSRTVTIVFPASEETRRYAIESALVSRVTFKPGDKIRLVDGGVGTVEETEERDGTLAYVVSGGRVVAESDLLGNISFSHPEKRLATGKVEPPELFDLRLRILEAQHRLRKSPVRGLIGGQIQLIPHQLYIASEVASRRVPRVMLSDEVGLGKTIEACLILHRLIRTGVAKRVLILVPESLIHQWFVELFRKFNLWFNLYGQEQHEQRNERERSVNYFLEEQLFIADVDLLAGEPEMARQAVEAGWDVVVVDEAHHLEWSQEEASPEYSVVDRLSAVSRGLLLLTATPEQMGLEGHFARLRLLDPDRYHDFPTFVEETRHYGEIADIADKILKNEALSAKDREKLADLLSDSDLDVETEVGKALNGDVGVRNEILEDLLDRRGPGRVVFRNTRANVKGFPKRELELHTLRPMEPDASLIEALAKEFADDAMAHPPVRAYSLEKDQRVAWLADFLQSNPGEKVLLICRTKEKALAIDAALRTRLNVGIGLFHESLPLIQRDRNTAWFAEEDGAQILICSEIGSEGRNFQFAHHLVLFDLPLNPELLEQRIGRLDRIGQTETIHIHAAVVEGSPQELLAEWYHKGLAAFNHSISTGHEFFGRFGDRVRELALQMALSTGKNDTRAEWKTLIKETTAHRREVERRLREGRDHLLELNSHRPEVAKGVISQIREMDEDTRLDALMLELYDFYGITVDEVAPRHFLLHPTELRETFPHLNPEGMAVHFDRRPAVSREDVPFISWDHPMVSGGMELFLGGGHGNCSFATLDCDEGPGLLLECVFVVEPVCAEELHADRFLPATPIRAAVDHAGGDMRGVFPSERLEGSLNEAPPHPFLDSPELTNVLVPKLIEACEALAEDEAETVRKAASEAAERQIREEMRRVHELNKADSHIPPEEMEMLERELEGLSTALAEAPVRLDAVRLIRLE